MSNLGNKEIMAKNIRKYMEILGKDRNEVCKDLGISYSTFTDWVNANKYPRIDKIELMANYFGVTKADLVEDESKNQYIHLKEYADLFSGIGGLNKGISQNTVYIQLVDEPAIHMHSKFAYDLVKMMKDMPEEDLEFLANTAKRISPKPKKKKKDNVVEHTSNQKVADEMEIKNVVPFPQYPSITNKDIDEFAARNAKKKFTREEIAEMLHEMKQEDE